VKITLSNPRTRAEFTNWPMGGGKRGPCVFEVHFDAKKGYRVSRTTNGKPKFTTFAGPAVIVDGSNGKTYVLRHVPQYGMIDIVRSDFKNASGEELGRSDTVWIKEDRQLYEELLALIREGVADAIA
jgi:hypothetical protein